jgi:hypothetical protein
MPSFSSALPRSAARPAALAIAALIALGVSMPAAARDCARIGPAQGFDGMLNALQMPGPPGYGETPGQDTEESVPVVAFEPPLCVADSDGAVVEPQIETIQLLDPEGKARSGLMGTRVMVTGVLERASTPAHRTPVVLRVVDVKQILKETVPGGRP